MNVTKIKNEIIKSGLIPLFCGAYILLTDPGIFWGMIGTSFLLIGIYYGHNYTKKTSDTSETRSQFKCDKCGAEWNVLSHDLTEDRCPDCGKLVSRITHEKREDDPA